MSDDRTQTRRIPLSAPAAFFRGPAAAVAVCPFLGSVDQVSDLGGATAVYDKGNRCFAYGAPVPLGQLQQELVCLTVAHEACPRYGRGIRYGPAGPGRQGLRTRLVALLAISALLVLGASLLSGPGLTFGPLGAFMAGGSQSPGPTPSPAVTPAPTPTVGRSPTPTLEPTPTPTPEGTPTATPTGAPILPTPPPGSAYATLAPCPDGELCYLYTVRSGDTLYAIARRFGTTISAIRALNPAVADTNVIRPGQILKIPPP